MRKNEILSLLVFLATSFFTLNSASGKGNIPFKMPEVSLPSIPNNTVSIIEFGAKGDGKTLNTESFARAIQTLNQKGGGKVVVPAGIWLTGPIQFENNIELHVERGALVLFTTDFDTYPLVNTIYEGNTSKKKMSPLYAVGKHDIAITGAGGFDAQGQAWRPSKKGKFTEAQWKELTSGDGVVVKNVWYPNAKQDELAGTVAKPDSRRVLQRPVLLEFTKCKRILLKEATFSNSPAWNVHPLMCEDVTIDNITVRNPWYAQNGDGLDLESCNRVIIKNSTFDVGDDAICIKSGKDKEGRNWKMPCQNVLIEGCTVLHGHGGFVIGSEMSSGAKNIYINNCLFNGTDTGLRLKSTRGRGGVVEKIYVSNINMVDIKGDAFTFDLYYANKPVVGKADGTTSAKDAIPSVTEETPCFRNLFISNITCCGAKRAIYINGLPEMPLENMQMKNSVFYSCDQGAEINYANKIYFDNVKIENRTGKRLVTNNVTELTEK